MGIEATEEDELDEEEKVSENNDSVNDLPVFSNQNMLND